MTGARNKQGKTGTFFVISERKSQKMRKMTNQREVNIRKLPGSNFKTI